MLNIKYLTLLMVLCGVLLGVSQFIIIRKLFFLFSYEEDVLMNY